MTTAYCTTSAILDSVMLEITDQGLRTKALAWLNQAIRDVLNQPREWKFLEVVAPLVIVNNQIAMPQGAAEIVYIKVGDTFYGPDNQLTDEAAQSGLFPGYTLAPDGTITFYPDATGTADIKYEAGLTTKYADNTNATIFPIQFENCLISGTLLRCFKFDKDGRFSSEAAIFEYQLKLCKAWDNTLKPSPVMSAHGYTRTFEASTIASPGSVSTGGAQTVVYTNTIKATDNNFYSLEIVDNGDGTFSPVFTRIA